MDWFKHTTTASNCPELRQLKMNYGFDGIGLFWILIEKIMLNQGTLPLEEALSWKSKEFTAKKIREIIYYSGLFWVDEDTMLVHCKEGLSAIESDNKTAPSSKISSEKKSEQTISSENNSEQTISSENNSEQNISSENNSEQNISSEKNSEQNQPNAPARKDKRDKKEKKEKKGIERVMQLLTLATTPEEQKFYQEMLDKFPNVCKLEEPLTYNGYMRIKKRYPDCDVGGVLQAMQNFRPLNKKYCSAYLTLNNWIKRE